MLKVYLQRKLYKLLGKTPDKMEMVSYWKTKESVSAKVTQQNGVTVMMLEGEKYPFPGFPRGYLLFGKLSKLKHEVKNQIFNDSWAKLEEGKSEKEVSLEIKQILPKIYEILEQNRFDMVPYEAMVPAVKEIYRAMMKVAPEHKQFIELITYILQEDDGYRFRVQWMVTYFGWLRFLNPIKSFERGLTILEHGEVIGDMKERIRLLRRVILTFLKDENVEQKFLAFWKEIDWNKVKMSKADKYFFRGKYFKVDYDKFSY